MFMNFLAEYYQRFSSTGSGSVFPAKNKDKSNIHILEAKTLRVLNCCQILRNEMSYKHLIDKNQDFMSKYSIEIKFNCEFRIPFSLFVYSCRCVYKSGMVQSLGWVSCGLSGKWPGRRETYCNTWLTTQTSCSNMKRTTEQ